MFALEYHTDVLAFGMSLGIFVVFHETRLGGVDSVIATHGAVLTGEPVGSALSEYDVAGNDILF